MYKKMEMNSMVDSPPKVLCFGAVTSKVLIGGKERHI